MKVEGLCDLEDARDDLRRAQNLMYHASRGEGHSPLNCTCDLCAMWIFVSALIQRADDHIKQEGGRGY